MELYHVTELAQKRALWGVFSRYHYLSHTFSAGAKVYVATVNDSLAAFCAVINFPHPKVDAMRIHRLVVLPAFQGCGVGMLLMDYVARLYHKQRKVMFITTTHPALIRAMSKSPHWICFDKGRKGKYGKNSNYKNSSTDRITTSWRFRP
ncbi:hypothetical protein GCM10023189_43300 [Nibrella saemangeumensis]|uniref:N-acetyltransferase domain-containing protein n=1 Tax=Nibrella saemangeumensis TaxID=1084526 RepID=A0ABP8NB18_9BACT